MSFEFSILITCAIIIGVLAIANGLVAYMILAERKIAAYMQDRVGPNRAFFRHPSANRGWCQVSVERRSYSRSCG